MHHPHVPHELKDFSKHLFATFLGLLMALGLEQWREHHHESKVAAEGLAQVEEELREDSRSMDRQIKRLEASLRTASRMEAYIGEVHAAKRLGKALPACPPLEDMGISPAFPTDAWETFKGMGSLRHIQPDRARKLSRIYLGLSNFHQNFITNPLLRQVPASTMMLVEKPERAQAMDAIRLAQAQEGFQIIQSFFLWCKNELEGMKKSCEAAL